MDNTCTYVKVLTSSFGLKDITKDVKISNNQYKFSGINFSFTGSYRLIGGYLYKKKKDYQT